MSPVKPAYVSLTFQGGPCNRKTVLYARAGLAAGTVSCGGALYTVGAIAGDAATATFHTQVVPTGGIAPQAMQGWNNLRLRINKTLPNNLYRADVYLRQALRELRHVRL